MAEEDRNNSIEIEYKMEKTYTHPHLEDFCEEFEMALTYHYLVVINGEVMIPRSITEFPDQDKVSAGNILTGEKYEKKNILLNLALTSCPFCKTDLRPKPKSHNIDGIGGMDFPEQF